MVYYSALLPQSAPAIAHAATRAPPPSRRETAPPRPPQGGDRDKPRSTVAVAAVERLHGDGLAKPCWYRVSVTLRPLGLAEIPILASRHSNFEGPRTTFKIERARYKIDTWGESSTTKGCSRHGFVLAPR